MEKQIKNKPKPNNTTMNTRYNANIPRVQDEIDGQTVRPERQQLRPLTLLIATCIAWPALANAVWTCGWRVTGTSNPNPPVVCKLNEDGDGCDESIDGQVCKYLAQVAKCISGTEECDDTPPDATCTGTNLLTYVCAFRAYPSCPCTQ